YCTSSSSWPFTSAKTASSAPARTSLRCCKATSGAHMTAPIGRRYSDAHSGRSQRAFRANRQWLVAALRQPAERTGSAGTGHDLLAGLGPEARRADTPCSNQIDELYRCGAHTPKEPAGFCPRACRTSPEQRPAPRLSFLSLAADAARARPRFVRCGVL